MCAVGDERPTKSRLWKRTDFRESADRVADASWGMKNVPKSRHRNGKDKKSRSKTSRGPVFLRTENPFRDIPDDVLARGLLEAGRSYEQEFEESLAKLADLIRSVDPLHLLSVLAVYGLFAGMTETGKIQRKKEPETAVQQAHVELAQAVALTIPDDQLCDAPAIPDKVQEIWDLLIALGKAFHLKRLVQRQHARTEEQKGVLQLQEQLRLHTQFVRNWGYFKRVVAITRRLYAPLDSLYQESVGLGATQLIRLFEYLVNRSETAINERWQRLRPVASARTMEEAVVAYCAAVPEAEDTPEDLIRRFREQGVSREMVLSIVLSHYDLQLPEVFTFRVSEIAAETGLDAGALRQALPGLCYRFGELGEADHERFFLGNPVWLKPLIQLSEDIYYCATPQVFFGFVFQILEELLADNADARRECARRRAEFLEDEVTTLLGQAFPGSEYTRNFRWRDNGVEYESDLLLKVDSYLLLVEAKSGSITWPALRGAPDRVKRHVEELLIEPARQSKRLADKLERARAGVAGDVDVLQQLPFDVENVQKIIRLSVTLEDFATIQANVASLKPTGWLDGEFAVSPTLALADLEIVIDILDSAPTRIHYLLRRAEFEEHMAYKGDELDLLGLYLDTAFNLGEVEFLGHSWMLVEMSHKIDEYYTALDQGIARKRPALRSTQWWTDIRRRIEERRPNRWSEVAVTLMNVSHDDQQSAQKAFKKIVKNVRKNWRREGHMNSIILEPPKWRRDAFGLLAFRDRQKHERHQFMENVAAQVFERSHAERCLIVGVNIDEPQYPYSVLGVYDRPRDVIASETTDN